jgi:hypothetical protein
MFNHLIETEQELFLSDKKSSMNLLYKVYGSDEIGKSQFLKSSIDELLKSWAPYVESFKMDRKKYLLYK